MFLLAHTRSDVWLLKVPKLGPALARAQAQDFFDSLGLLLEAGVPMFEAMPMAVATISNRAMRQAYAAVLPRLQQGATLSQALEDAVTAPQFFWGARACWKWSAPARPAAPCRKCCPGIARPKTKTWRCFGTI